MIFRWLPRDAIKSILVKVTGILVMFLKSIAQKVAKTKFGQKSLTQSEHVINFRQKPGVRVYLGLAFIVISSFALIPSIAPLSFLSLKFEEPLIVAIGSLSVFILVHIIFSLGIYLAGKNYAKELLSWATKRFLEKFGL